MIRIAAPAPRSGTSRCPAATWPAIGSSTGPAHVAEAVSAARTAYPSIAELRNGGTSSRATTSAARTMSAASSNGNVIAGRGENPERTCFSAASTSSRRSTSSQGRSMSGVVGSGTSADPVALCSRRDLGAEPRHRVDQVLHGRRGLLERGRLLGGQRKLDDLSHPLASQLDWHADEQAIDSVLALKVNAAGQHAPLVEKDRVDHLHNR